uniref:Uncharacterized protein n=1 Tax=Kalmanozyma brasiliensis (strain GHG001) TaxID=1365824 RepID=V5EVD8_KALBG
MLSLRSLQSKIRVCAEDIRIKPIPGLHGVEPSQAVATFEKESDDAAIASQLGATLESMRDDFVGLSAEWEATIKLVYKEKRRSPSPQPSIDLEADASASSAARDLVSPLEADEDDIHPLRTNGSSDSGLPASDGQAQDATLGNASDNEDDEDLAALLLSSTSPNSLPPPGLEQVFESIAGMAGLGDESMLSVSDDFSFEPTALESVPEDDAAATASILPSPHWESTSSKATPKASQAPLFSSTATAVPESPFDLGAQVAAYARRKKAAKAQAAAMQASGSESSVASQASQ